MFQNVLQVERLPEIEGGKDWGWRKEISGLQRQLGQEGGWEGLLRQWGIFSRWKEEWQEKVTLFCENKITYFSFVAIICISSKLQLHLSDPHLLVKEQIYDLILYVYLGWLFHLFCSHNQDTNMHIHHCICWMYSQP